MVLAIYEIADRIGNEIETDVILITSVFERIADLTEYGRVFLRISFTRAIIVPFNGNVVDIMVLFGGGKFE
ncbi:hypothetical protein CWI76_10970 [Pseudidiomarina marina]|uniref:Uncharacterized protein n=1 Tax=Pseudidiomarina marina TaxID=502366 RepID=A0A432YCA5_9GAMM|nr:hypothetical protein CWI76_10970 [Pseudidiomarina marina]